MKIEAMRVSEIAKEEICNIRKDEDLGETCKECKLKFGKHGPFDKGYQCFFRWLDKGYVHFLQCS